MVYSIKDKHEIKDLDELDDLQSQVKQVRLVEKLGKQGYHFVKKELFQPITETITYAIENLHEETKSITKQLRVWTKQTNTLKL